MHTINIHLDESLGRQEMDSLRSELLTDSHVRNVELHEGQPHDLLVECDDHEDVPLHVLDILKSHGFHADIVGC